MGDRPETWRHRAGGIAAVLLFYGGVMAFVVWAMVTYPIDH